MNKAGLSTDNLVLALKYEEDKEQGIQNVTSFIQNTRPIWKLCSLPLTT